MLLLSKTILQNPLHIQLSSLKHTLKLTKKYLKHPILQNEQNAERKKEIATMLSLHTKYAISKNLFHIQLSPLNPTVKTNQKKKKKHYN